MAPQSGPVSLKNRIQVCNDQSAIAPKHRDYSIDGDAIKAELDLPGTDAAAQRTRDARPEKVAYSASCRDLISADFQEVSFSTAVWNVQPSTSGTPSRGGNPRFEFCWRPP